MTLKRKLAISILTLVCITMTLLSFEAFSISSSSNYISYETTSSNEVIASNASMINTDFLMIFFTPLKVVSTLAACLSVLILALTYGIYRRFLHQAKLAMYAPLAVLAVSTLVIILMQGAASFQLWIGLFVLCLLAFILTITDKKYYQSND